MNPWKFIKPFAVMKIISWQCTWQKRLSIIQRCGMIHFDISHLVFRIKRMDPSSVIRAQVSGVVCVCVCVCVSARVSRKFIMQIKKASLIWLQAKLTLERRCVCVCVRERERGTFYLFPPALWDTCTNFHVPHKNVYHGITLALIMHFFFSLAYKNCITMVLPWCRDGNTMILGNLPKYMHVPWFLHETPRYF